MDLTRRQRKPRKLPRRHAEHHSLGNSWDRTGDGIPAGGKHLGRNRAGQTVSNGKVTVKFDRDGFAEFNTKFETLLDDVHVGSGQRFSHYKAANQKLSQAIKQDPRLAKELGLSADAIEKLSSSTKPPIGYSWHHHQDVGRMQLVSLEEHQLAAPHTGGMAIWGGGQ